VNTFLRYLSGSRGTPYRSRHYLHLEMDEEKAVETTSFFLRDFPQLVFTALFWKATVGDKVQHYPMPDITWRAARRCVDFLVVASPELLREWF